MKKRLFIVIPAYNEGRTIGEVLDGLLKAGYKNIIIVDDGSRDKTSQICEKKKVTVLKHLVNLGKGAAVKTGCDFAVKQDAEVLVLFDADGQHEEKEIPMFLKALKSKDIVFGYREFSKTMPIVFRIGNKFINYATKFLYNMDLKDTQCGFRAMTAKTYKKVRWEANDYSMETEMIANAGKHNLKYSEIPVKTIYSDRYKGTTIVDGIRIVINMLIWRFKK
jgi:glycosyltransferase involved in cell wall biosynthesis